MPLWMQPEVDDKQTPVFEALECTKYYLNDIFNNVEFGGTKQKIFNTVYSTLVDAYLDRFILAANETLKLKLNADIIKQDSM